MTDKTFYTTWDPFLLKYHLYYRNLSDSGKKRFVERVHSIYDNVEIIGKENLEVNDEIRILVISNLVQLTFGLKEFWLFGYDYIYLYPEAFTVGRTSQFVKGSTYKSKIISLSWEDFAHDHLHARDGKNVSFAQYALALLYTVFNGKRFDLRFGSYLDTWFEIIRKECQAKADGTELQHLNDNQDDLDFVFSKSVEMFFEKPDLLKKELPTSYAHLCLLLNQDPTNITEDYRYERERLNKSRVLVDLPKTIPINYKYKAWHWLYNFSFFGITACPVLMAFIIEDVLISTEQILMLIFAAGLLIPLAFFSYLKKKGLYQNFLLLLGSSILGFGPCLVTGVLVINSMYGYPFTSEVSRHKIAAYYHKNNNMNSGKSEPIIFVLSDGFLNDYPKTRTFETFDKPPKGVPSLFSELEYEIRRGIFGIPIIYKRELY